MKNIIRLPVPAETQILISVGEEVTSKTPLLAYTSQLQTVNIAVADILKVPKKKVISYLKKKPSEEIKEGEILCLKKSYFSSIEIKSPVSGQIADINLKNGTLTIVQKGVQKDKKIMIPVDGKIKSVTQNEIEIEIHEHILSGEVGDGGEVIGKLVILDDFPTLWETDINLVNSIVSVRRVTGELLIKLEILGAAGVIIGSECETTTLPWIRMSDEFFSKLTKYSLQKGWLRPKQHQLVIFDTQVS